MLIRTHKRVSNKSEMIARLNHVLLSSYVCERGSVVQNRPSVSIRFQYFCSSRLTQNPKVLTESLHPLESSLSHRVSRVARTEAQDALFDYLHCTRSFRQPDAEYISKNSPHFIQNLLSKIGTEKDVSHSLIKFFRYNPINEFEPFFESLGLCPSELPSHLPRHLMFLSDDLVMLDNFHVLCDYGIPRGKIGKIYSEAKEVFQYDFGVLQLKLQACENLGLSKVLVIKLVTCCPSLLVRDTDHEFIEVLQKLRALGIESDWIGNYITSSRLYNWSRMLDTMNFLDNVGYTKANMCNLFKENPGLLFEGSGKKVYVLFGRLLKLGLKMEEACLLFQQNSHILTDKSLDNLLKAVDFLIEIGMCVEEVAKIVTSNVRSLGSYTMKRPKTVYKEFKVERQELCHLIVEDPPKLLRLASKSKNKGTSQISFPDPSTHMEKTAFLLRLGYTENSDEMMKALKQFRGRGDLLQERFDCLVQAGLDCNIVTNIVKQAPMVLNQSKDVIEKKINYLIKFLGYPLQSLVAFPAYLCYDLERIKLRFSMYVWLRERDAAKPMLSLSTLFACSNARFVKYFVDVHPEGQAFWKALKDSLTLS